MKPGSAEARDKRPLKARTNAPTVKRNGIGISVMVVSAVFTCSGQYVWKISGTQNLALIALGFGLYGTGALFMILALRFGSLSVLHPVMSISYVFALPIGYFLLGEAVGITKILGVTAILVGVVLISLGDG